jgi:hypothetical protein
MDIEDEAINESPETGSDELLSADDLRLPDSANILVRVHAVRAWLTRRQQEAALEVGEAALALQEVMQYDLQETRPRRRQLQLQQERIERIQQALVQAQQRLQAYEDAQTLLEEYIAHTNGERVLVEYYLALDELLQQHTHEATASANEQKARDAWLEAIAAVQRRIEHVGTLKEEE